VQLDVAARQLTVRQMAQGRGILGQDFRQAIHKMQMRPGWRQPGLTEFGLKPVSRHRRQFDATRTGPNDGQ
jgi:hypothetical protein